MQQLSMENFTHVTVDKLSLDCIQNLVPKGLKNLCLSDAVEGAQPPDTYILGSVLEIHKKIEIKNVPRKRVIVREVLADGTDGVKVNVSLYKNIANDLDRLLKSTKTTQGQWLIICNADLSVYMGPDPKEYCRLFVRVSFGDSNSRVWLLTERSGSVVPNRDDQQVAGTSYPTAPTQNSVLKKSYTQLKNCKLGQKYNVLAVVSEIVKNPSVTRNGNLHMLVGISDPSSPYEDGGIKDMLLQIFCRFTDEAKDFLGGIETGQVIRIRDMMMELYMNEVRAKVFSERQLVLFPGGTDEDVVPKAIVTGFELSDELINLVQSLRAWSAEHRKDFQIKKKGGDDGVDMTTPACPSLRNSLEMNTLIKEIDKPMVFHIWCEIFQKRSVHSPAESMLILQVRDGTNTILHFKKYDFEETTQDLMSETEMYCQPGSEVVDIFVKGKVNVSKDLEVGDVVCLKRVSCYRVDPNGEDDSLSFFELILEEDATIMKPSKFHSENKRIKEMIRKRHEMLLSESSQDTLCDEVAMSLKRIEHPNELRSPKPHSVRSPNRINTQPVSVPHARSNAHPTKQGVLSLSPRLGLPNIHSQLSCPKPGSSRFASPKLPSQTDSLESAVRNISDLSGRKQRESDHSPLRKASSPLQGKCSPHNARRRILSGNLIEDLDVSRIEFPPDLPSSTQLTNSPVQSEGRFHHPSVQGINMGKPAQAAHVTTPAGSKNMSHLPDKTIEAAYANMAQEESSPSNDPMGDNSELDLVELSPTPPTVNCIGVEENRAAEELSSSSEILSETVIQCSGSTASTRMSTNGDSEEIRIISTLNNHVAGTKSKNQNSFKRKIQTSAQNGEGTTITCITKTEPQPSTSKGFEDPNSVKRKSQSTVPNEGGTSTNCIINNKAILTTECHQSVIYTTLHALLSEGKEGVLYLVPGIVKQMFTSSDHRCDKQECLNGGMCCHNWVWGLCEGCGNCFDSEELRQKFPIQDFAKSRLPCVECCRERSPSASTYAERNNSDSLPESAPPKKRLRSSTASKSKTSKNSKLTISNTRKSRSYDSKTSKAKTVSSVKASNSEEDQKNVGTDILPFMHLSLRLTDPGDGSEILLLLGGDHAKQFFGIEPTFKWLTEKADDTLAKLVPLLLQQKTLLWFGVLKSVNSASVVRYQLAHTSLKMVLRNQDP